MDLLWCNKCYYAHDVDRWRASGHKYGVCPHCGVSEFRNAVPWLTMADIHGWLLSIPGDKYSPAELDLTL